jgi:hypothetical protein
MVILHDQLSSFKERKVVPVQREFFSENMKNLASQFQREFFLENMKESAIQFQKESTSELKDERLQFQSISDDDEDLEAVAWRTIAVRFKEHSYSNA